MESKDLHSFLCQCPDKNESLIETIRLNQRTKRRYFSFSSQLLLNSAKATDLYGIMLSTRDLQHNFSGNKTWDSSPESAAFYRTPTQSCCGSNA